MRCAACNKNLTDMEAGFKYCDWKQIPIPEDRYPLLCVLCLKDTGIWVEGNPLASDKEFQDEEPLEEEEEDDLAS